MLRSHVIALLSSICLLPIQALAAQPATSSTAPVSTPAPAVATNGNEPVTRDQLPGLIKEALLKDPSILTEVVEKMQANQEAEIASKAKEAIAKRKQDIFSDPNSPVVGGANADVTIVEFFDYHCGYCKQALGSFSKLLDSDKKVRIIFKEYPILSEDSRLASKAALAVNRIAKDKYFEFHKAMFNANGVINERFISEQAKKLGVDPDKVKTEMAKPEIEAMLEKNKELGMAIGAMGTPAIIIGENFYPGAIPYEAIKKGVAKIRSGDNTPIEPPKM